MRRLARRVRAVLFRSRAERELAEELRLHLELEAAERARHGEAPDQARREAAVAFGGYDAVTEACRDERGVGGLEDVVRDVRYAVRSLARSPGFTVTAAGVLALGIGAATAAFSIADAVLFRPLAYPSAERLVSLYERNEAGGLRLVSHPTFRDWEAGARGFDGLAYIRGDALGVRSDEGTRTLLVGYATDGFFATMGTAAEQGRVWDAREAAAGAAVAVLSRRAWRESFGGDPAIVGREISTEAGSVTVVGVMPAGFAYPDWADLWMPVLAIPAGARRVLDARDLHVDSRTVGRIAADASPEAALASLGAVSAQLAEVHPDARGFTATHVPLRDELLGNAGARLAVLCGAVAVLLLLACANVAGLLIARGATRGREFATRIALGAGRRRVVRQLLAESTVLALLGGAAGVLLAVVAVRAIVLAAPTALPRLDGVSVNGWVLAFALGLSALAALFFGLAPAFRAARVSPMELLRGGRGDVGGRMRTLRAALVVGEVALATTLAVAAVLLVRTLDVLSGVDLGFDIDRVVAVRVTPPSPRYDDPAAALTLYRRMEEAARRVPGVASAGLVNHLPLSGTSMPTPLRGGRDLDADESPLVLYRTASADYAGTLGIDLVRGRAFAEEDVASASPVALVNESLARSRWGEDDPVGRTITVQRAAQGRAGFGEEVSLTVVGVLADTRHFGAAQAPLPTVYVPVSFDVWPNIFLAVRAADDPAVVAERLRRALLEVDALLPIAGPGFSARVRPLAEYEVQTVRERRLNAAVLTSFAALAFALATVGVFGIMTYFAVQRRREFGVRLSLGARPRDVVRLVVVGGVRLVALGAVLGVIGAAFATRLLRGMLFGVEPGDARSFALAAGLFLIAGIVASAIPALRAAGIHPASVLREE